MSYQHGWYVPQRVIFARVWGDQTIQEIEESSAGLTALLDKGTPLVHLLMDDSGIGNVPVNLGQLRNAMSFARSPVLGWVVLVGDSGRVTKFVVEMLGKILRIPIHRSPTLDDALTFLKDRDITIPWENADSGALVHRQA